MCWVAIKHSRRARKCPNGLLLLSNKLGTRKLQTSSIGKAKAVTTMELRAQEYPDWNGFPSTCNT